MENWQNWIISTLIVLTGVIGSFLMEVLISEGGTQNRRKSMFFNAYISFFMVYIVGNMLYGIFGKPWSQDIAVFTLYQAFLFVILIAYVLVMKILRNYLKQLDEGRKELSKRGNTPASAFRCCD